MTRHASPAAARLGAPKIRWRAAPGTAATRTWAFLLAVALMGGGAAAGAPLGERRRDYQFVNIADSAGPLATDDQYLWSQPAVNNAGTVAFVAPLDEGGAALFTGSGGPLTRVVATGSGGFASLDRQVAINDNGTIAFRAGVDVRDPHQRSVFTVAPAGTLTTIASGYLVPSGLPPYVPPQRYPSFRSGVGLDRHDAVTFMMDPDGETRAIFAGEGGPLRMVADTRGPLASIFTHSVNDAGAAAFLASPDGDIGVYVAAGAPCEGWPGAMKRDVAALFRPLHQQPRRGRRGGGRRDRDDHE